MRSIRVTTKPFRRWRRLAPVLVVVVGMGVGLLGLLAGGAAGWPVGTVVGGPAGEPEGAVRGSPAQCSEVSRRDGSMRSAPQPHQPRVSAETSAELSEHPVLGSAETPADSVPLLLVPGWADEAARIEPLRRAFLAEGWSPTRVAAVDFEDPFGSNLEHAREIARAVEGLASLTRSERVDVVAHSMGGLALRHYLHFEGGAERVRRVVFLGTPHRGSMAAMLAWGAGGREMVPGSEFLNRLNGEPLAVPEQVEALSIRTATDLRVIPGTSAVLSGAPNLEVCCPSHEELIEGGARVLEHVVAFLREGPDGVPDANVPTDWIEESEERFEPGLGSWSLWGGGWAEETLRRWLLPSWNAPREKGGDDGG